MSSSDECLGTSQFIVKKLGVRSKRKGEAGEKEQEMRRGRIGAGEKELESRDEELERRSKRKGAELS